MSASARRPRRSRAALVTLTLLTLVLFVMDLTTGLGGPAERVRGAAAGGFGAAERAAAQATRSLANAGRGLTGQTEQEVDQLRRENDALKLQLAITADQRRRIAELDALLKTASLGQYPVVPARVVAASGAQDPQRLVTIDAGTKDGIRSDLTVISGRGLVGRVLRAGPLTSDVLLLSDPGFSVGVRLEGTGLIGVATGAGANPLELRLLDAQTRVAPGARLVTLGSAAGMPFVPGVPVGEIGLVRATPGTLSRSGTITPYADPTALDLVAVVTQPPRVDPRDAVLPPAPAPTPVRR